MDGLYPDPMDTSQVRFLLRLLSDSELRAYPTPLGPNGKPCVTIAVLDLIDTIALIIETNASHGEDGWAQMDIAWLIRNMSFERQGMMTVVFWRNAVWPD